MADASEVEIPAPYVSRGVIGGGGVAVVHEVLDPRSDTVLALKLWRQPATPRVEMRFRREAELMRSIRHPHLIAALDFGLTPRPWLVMPRLRGSWHQRLRGSGALDPFDALVVVRDALRGLLALHQRDLVHRDVKPSNLLMGPRGTTVVGDLGIVRAPFSELTRTDAMVGSLLYMAPEQRRDPRAVGPAADLFALGACLWALTVGRNPPDLSLLSYRPALAGKLPPPVRPLVLRAVAPRPEDRFASAEAMGEAVAVVLARQVSPHPPPVRRPPAR